jgi:hypothetical protein
MYYGHNSGSNGSGLNLLLNYLGKAGGGGGGGGTTVVTQAGQSPTDPETGLPVQQGGDIGQPEGANQGTGEGSSVAQQPTTSNPILQPLNTGRAAEASKTYGHEKSGGSASGLSSLCSLCWVAREVFGAENPPWLEFRAWLHEDAPRWFFRLYLRFGERFARWVANKPRLKSVIRRWMEQRIERDHSELVAA